MAGPKGLSAATVRAIFRSKEPAKQLAAHHRVSVNLVYLIQQRKIHKAITEGIRKPIRKRKSRVVRGKVPTAPRLDLNRLADRVAELVTKRLLSGLVDRLRGKR
jgi:hypothetical protein